MERAVPSVLLALVAAGPLALAAAPPVPLPRADPQLGGGAEDDDVELVVEELPGGGRVERHVRRGLDGGAVLHGDYRRWHPNGELREAGTYADGEKVGRWESWHPNGEPRTREHWRRGLRDGEWRWWNEEGRFRRKLVFEAEFEEHPDGSPRWRGEYLVLGRRIRDGSWTFFHPGGTVRCEGEYSRGTPAGRWTWYWWDGTLQLEGEYERAREDGEWIGRRTGDWVFHHRGGPPDPAFLSGTWRDGVRRPPGEPPEGADPTAARLAPPAAFPGMRPEEERALSELVLEAMVAEDEEQHEARVALDAAGIRALPSLLAALSELDLEDRRARIAGARVWGFLPKGLHDGLLEAWKVDGEGAARHDAFQRLRWFTLWELFGRDPTALLGLAPAGHEGLLESVVGAAPDEASPWNTPPPEVRRHGEVADALAVAEERLAAGAEGTEAALPRAIDRLCATQAADGSWPGGVLPTCHALLALAGVATAADEGPVGRAVARGVEWLVETQEPLGAQPQGADPARVRHEPALVAFALAEGSFRVRDPALRREIQRHFDGLLRSRREEEGGADAFEARVADPTGTAWEAIALAYGNERGFRILYSHLEWTDEWLAAAEERADPSDAETVGLLLWCRRAIGLDDPEDEEVRRAVDRLAAALPALRERGADAVGAWCRGAYGIEWVGGAAWAAWNEAMKEALVAAQHADGGWGGAGADGVQRTALAAFALQVYDRFRGHGAR